MTDNTKGLKQKAASMDAEISSLKKLDNYLNIQISSDKDNEKMKKLEEELDR